MAVLASSEPHLLLLPLLLLILHLEYEVPLLACDWLDTKPGLGEHGQLSQGASLGLVLQVYLQSTNTNGQMDPAPF